MNTRLIEDIGIGNYICLFLIDPHDGTRVAVIETPDRIDTFDPRDSSNASELEDFWDAESPSVPVHLLAIWWIEDGVLPSEIEPARVARLLLEASDKEGVQAILDTFSDKAAAAVWDLITQIEDLLHEITDPHP